MSALSQSSASDSFASPFVHAKVHSANLSIPWSIVVDGGFLVLDLPSSAPFLSSPLVKIFLFVSGLTLTASRLCKHSLLPSFRSIVSYPKCPLAALF